MRCNNQQSKSMSILSLEEMLWCWNAKRFTTCSTSFTFPVKSSCYTFCYSATGLTSKWSIIINYRMLCILYDAKTPLAQVRDLLKDETLYPMKIRCKMAVNNTLSLMNTMYGAILPFIEQIAHFIHLSSRDRSRLIERNIKSAGRYSGIVICRGDRILRKFDV